MIEADLSVLQPPQHDCLPVFPVRVVVVFPGQLVAVYAGRKVSIEGIEAAMRNQQQIVVLAQIDAKSDEVHASSMHQVGVLANIQKLFKLPDGTHKVWLLGEHRVQCGPLELSRTGWITTCTPLLAENHDALSLTLLAEVLLQKLARYVALQADHPEQASIKSLSSDLNPEKLLDQVLARVPLESAERQILLETADLVDRYQLFLKYLSMRIDRLALKKQLNEKVQDKMSQSQREHYLQQQLRAIQDELHGDGAAEDLDKKIKACGMTPEAEKKALSEARKLQQMSPSSAEATVVQNYIDCLLSLPWKKRSRWQADFRKTQAVLDRDHFGLVKVKERLLEFLAVQHRVKKIRGAVLCLVGPPGVGKTSLGQSIAAATGRKFVRIPLGGLRDESEIRGHRRTYVGAMPGKIIQKIVQAKVRNPVVMLDEIDKMAMDHRGDPASALLEVLDAEQNHHFDDHYLEVGFDLSEVLFIATANTLDIPAPLLDRMEVIRLPGYTMEEKLTIAQKYLLAKQMDLAGLSDKDLRISTPALRDTIHHYTKEAGVRSLDRQIEKMCRKVVKAFSTQERQQRASINAANLTNYLGVPQYHTQPRNEQQQLGQVTGLAWTEVGGEILTIEATVMAGKGQSQTTGSLGDVMQESILAAVSVIRAGLSDWHVPEDFFEKHDWHVHVPEGATPKDGPSAGIGMCTALLSVVLQKPVRSDIAMTGEITLRGEVLPIGGLKEKCLAALREGLSAVIIPQGNLKDLKDFASEIKPLTIHPVKTIQEVWALALVGFDVLAPTHKTEVDVAVQPEASLDAPTLPVNHAQPVDEVLADLPFVKDDVSHATT